MIKLLYNLFSKQFNSLAFEDNKVHGDWRDNCKVHYISTSGHRYFTPKNLFNDLWIKRREYLENLLALNQAGFNKEDKDKWISNAGSVIDTIIKDIEKQGAITLTKLFEELARIRSMIDLLDSRFKVLIEPDVLLSMMACILVREDENPAVITDSIVDRHVEQFKIDDKLRDNAFFLDSGLDQFIPYLTSYKENWKQFIQEGMNQKKILQKGEDKIFHKQFSKELEPKK